MSYELYLYFGLHRACFAKLKNLVNDNNTKNKNTIFIIYTCAKRFIDGLDNPCFIKKINGQASY